MRSASGFLMVPYLRKYRAESTSFSFAASPLRATVPPVFETLFFFAFDRVSPAWDNFGSWTFMNSKCVVLLLSLVLPPALPAAAQQNPAPSASAAPTVKSSPRGDAYYNFAIGHLYELQYEQTSQPDFASKAIEAYKKAYAIDPQSPIIGERLALRPLCGGVEGHAGQQQRDGKVDKHHVLRMLGQEHRLDVEGMHVRLLAYFTTTSPVIFGWLEQK